MHLLFLVFLAGAVSGVDPPTWVVEHGALVSPQECPVDRDAGIKLVENMFRRAGVVDFSVQGYCLSDAQYWSWRKSN